MPPHPAAHFEPALRGVRVPAVVSGDRRRYRRPQPLRGLSPKDITGLNRRGICTVTQFSHTFRPGRLKRLREMGGRHEHALQALAVRENKVYIARRPRLPDGKVRAYFDVEGLPDRGFDYLIACMSRRNVHVRSSFWADREMDERGIGMRSSIRSENSEKTSPCTTTGATRRTF